LRLPRVTGKEVLDALLRAGFIETYVKGSHHHLMHQYDSSRWAVIPVHSGKVLPPKTLKSILRTAKLTFEELNGLL
jgi:predicted RNA binding protein YcfA (HicA-like mRNA interferase family)